MSAPAAGNGAVGKAIAAGFLVLFLNGPAPDVTKMAVAVGAIVYLAVNAKSSKPAAGGDGGH